MWAAPAGRPIVLNLVDAGWSFYSAADSFDSSLLCAIDLQLLWFFCRGRQSGLSSWERKKKAEAFRNSKVASISPVHAQLAPIRSLRVTLQASVRPCSRNVRCSTSAAPATHAATGQCLTSSTGRGPTRSTSVRGKCQHSTRAGKWVEIVIKTVDGRIHLTPSGGNQQYSSKNPVAYRRE